ncbi:MAG: MBOAT family protein, partial [Proteobacteria bacterium]|nr:MBOAT family protein [Pseudomonadota bacterium]
MLGLSLIAWGLFQKTVLADSLYSPLVDQYFAEPIAHGAASAWLAVFSFSMQIYFDFSGYSLCAVGAAIAFGFALMDNFNAPYAACGFSDFWRRWHISLSQWLRDYLYIPLGGSRRGRPREILNIVTVMMIAGLWHGAGWQFP